MYLCLFLLSQFYYKTLLTYVNNVCMLLRLITKFPPFHSGILCYVAMIKALLQPELVVNNSELIRKTYPN